MQLATCVWHCYLGKINDPITLPPWAQVSTTNNYTPYTSGEGETQLPTHKYRKGGIQYRQRTYHISLDILQLH